MLLRIRSHPQVAMSAFGPLGIELSASAGGGFTDGAPHTEKGNAVDLYNRVRSKTVLHRAWAKVRSSGLSSSSERTERDTRQFDADWLNNLEKIREQLQKGMFAFTGEMGVTPRKGKGKAGVRPLVIAPIANRVVRRAILEVLQGFGEETDNARRRWAGVPAVRDVMATSTSVGGISKRSVPHGLAHINQALREGKNWFGRSDIQNFFTRIPTADIN